MRPNDQTKPSQDLPQDDAHAAPQGQPADYESDDASKPAGQSASANGMSTVGGPARGYSWPPFEDGNTVSVRSGAYSERMIEARAAEVRTQLFELAPWLDRDIFVPAVARFLRAEARELLLHEHIVKVSDDKGIGAVPEKAWEQATAASNAAMKASALLGLDPQSYARLRAVTGHAATTEASLADVTARGRQTAGYAANVTQELPNG